MCNQRVLVSQGCKFCAPLPVVLPPCFLVGALFVQEYDYHLGAVNTITFVDEGRRFVTTSDDKTIRVWEYGIPVQVCVEAGLVG
jgi:WD40 repeat protein